MPAGNISFVGLPGSDAQLLALAHSYEQRSRRFAAPLSPRSIHFNGKPRCYRYPLIA